MASAGPGEPPAPPATYDPAYFERLFAIEDRHFWFRARRRVIAKLIAPLARELPPGFRVLEVGCGTGTVLRTLEVICRSGTVVGMDLFAEGLRFARRRTACPLVRGDVRAAPFAASFDIVGMFDVLEHLPDDVRVLADLRGALAPGGVLLLTVPAQPSLWSYFDEASHHCRRYGRSELERKLQLAGFRIEYLTYYMTALFPLLWAARQANRRLPPRGGGAAGPDELARRELRVLPGLNGALGWLLEQEARLIARRRQLPFGTSLLAIARQDDNAGDTA